MNNSEQWALYCVLWQNKTEKGVQKNKKEQIKPYKTQNQHFMTYKDLGGADEEDTYVEELW